MDEGVQRLHACLTHRWTDQHTHTYLSGGVYVRPERQDALLQYFLSLFLPGHRLRQVRGFSVRVCMC